MLGLFFACITNSKILNSKIFNTFDTLQSATNYKGISVKKIKTEMENLI